MAKFLNNGWNDPRYYYTTGTTSSSTTWYDVDNDYYRRQREAEFQYQVEEYHRRQREALPPATFVGEVQPPPPEGTKLPEQTALDWLRDRVDEICNQALVDVA